MITLTFDPSLYVVVPRAELEKYLIEPDPMSFHGELLQCQACGGLGTRAGHKRGTGDEPVKHKSHCLLTAAPPLPEQPQGESLIIQGKNAEPLNHFIGRRYDELMYIGKHGHYETLFGLVRECFEHYGPRHPSSLPEITLRTCRHFLNEKHPESAYDLKAQIDAAIISAAPAVAAAPATDSYVQEVPDKCDRIVWRGDYYHLPLKEKDQGSIRASVPDEPQPAVREDVDLGHGERRVVCSAISNGEIVICGIRHFDPLMGRIVQLLHAEQWKWTQGFVDNRSVFMTREEAFVVAEAADQILNRRFDGRLHSEDFIPGYLPEHGTEKPR